MKTPLIPARLLVLAWMTVSAGISLGANAPTTHTLSLAGTWQFQMDPGEVGERENWPARDLPLEIQLPGSLQERGFGDPISERTRWTGGTGDRAYYTADRYAPYRKDGNVHVPFWLQPERYYVGPAWYRREVTIPSAWTGQRVVLSLERPHWGTKVWLDADFVGECNALGVPHDYDLGRAATPGKHTITVRVDNRVLVPVGNDAHSVTDHTQGNWNGLAGDLRLYTTGPVWLETVQVFPLSKSRQARVRLSIGNLTGQAGSGELLVQAQTSNGQPAHRAPPARIPVKWTAGTNAIEFVYELGPDARLWDEFQPAVYALKVEIPGVASPVTSHFGLREVGVAGTQITINGRPIFLRGTLECCIFPLHGYPPTQVHEWRRVLEVARAHGLNHLRFHSWCPPEAAFVAADELGFYYQVECSTWASSFNAGTALDQWIYAESERMSRAYGNHPSFLLMAPSNEPGGPDYTRFLGDFVNYWKARDDRRLYTAGSGWPSIPENQYHVTPAARGFPVRAAFGETANDYHEFLASQTVPVVSHEIGQYCVFPNLDEIPKYRGLLKPRNFEIVRDFLAASGLSAHSRDFLKASGKLQAIFYKDEIEACLRTPGWAGFQLLDLHDFPGQGTALVGVLDAFWEEKGYIKPQEYRRFCAETVPLARLPKRIWLNQETFKARVEAAHFGPANLSNVRPHWRITRNANEVVAQGNLGPVTVKTGGLTPLGEVEWQLDTLAQAAALNLEISFSDTSVHNDWNFWVYPTVTPTPSPAHDILVTNHLDPQALGLLEQGSSVVLFADPRRINAKTTGRFDPIFWNKLWFPTQPQHTLGLLIQPSHPALATFPTDFHADWQWQDVQNRSKPMDLTALPSDLQPIVQVIDDWNTCRKLALIFEAKVGAGRVLVCSADLQADLEHRPTARQLRHSLVTYAASPTFNPKTSLKPESLRSLFRDLTLTERLGVRVVEASSQQAGYEAQQVLDGQPETLWHTPWGQNVPGFPHSLVLGWNKSAQIAGVNLLPRQDNNPNGWIQDYEIYVSSSPEAWGEPVAKGRWNRDGSEKLVRFPRPVVGQFLKLVALSGFDNQPFASLAELSLVPLSE